VHVRAPVIPYAVVQPGLRAVAWVRPRREDLTPEALAGWLLRDEAVVGMRRVHPGQALACRQLPARGVAEAPGSRAAFHRVLRTLGWGEGLRRSVSRR
jgi:hypothetical protein